MIRRDAALARALMLSAALGGLVAGSAHAAGFYLEDQSAKASGRAFSGEASDLGSEQLWYNPAAIAGIASNELAGGFTAILVDSKVTNRGSTITYPFGGPTLPISGAPRAYKPVDWGVLPNVSGAYRLNDQWSVGLAVTSPYSFITKYRDADTFVRYDAITTRLTTIDVQPTVAWRPLRWLGLGAGPNVEYSNAVFSNALPNLSPLLPDGSTYLHGNGWDVGYNVGAQLRPLDTVTVGLAYRSKITHHLDGGASISGLLGPLAGENASFPAKAAFNTPWAATFGVRWQATPQLAVEGQAVRFGWREFSQIALSAPLVNQPENYRDTTSGSVGLDYDVTPRWTMRAGVQYDQTPTPDNGRDARVPDGDRWMLAAGSSYKVTPHLLIDAAFSYIDIQRSHIDHDASAYVGTPVMTPISLLGDVQADVVTLSLGSRFYF